MKEPLTISALAKSAWLDFLRTRNGLYIFEALFKLVEAWLLIPAIAVVLTAILSWAGHIAISNEDIVAFLLTPLGLLYAALLSTVTAALLILELAGIMLLVTLSSSIERPPLRQTLRIGIGRSLRLVGLGAVQVTILVLALLPFLLLAVLTYWILLSEHDIYFYLKDRPPVFWLAAGIGGLLVLAALAVSMWLYVRWAFALPILLFENPQIRAAQRASRERVRGMGWRVCFVLLSWWIGALVFGAVVEAGFRLGAAAVLNLAGERPVALMVLLLVVQGGLLATLSFFLVVGTALITRRLYLVRRGELGIIPQSSLETGLDKEKPIKPWNWWLALLWVPLLLLAPLVLWIELVEYVKERPLVRVTAHRGHARAAPENTLSAMRKAIESGADYVEMDVQLTADGTVVLLHDRDLKRVAGVARRLDELSSDEVRQLDVGSWFAPAFSGERVPTLVEVIDLCRGKIRLNIELKFFGPDRRLTQKVLDIIREQALEDECLVTSLNYDALLEAKQHHPRLRTGLIVAHALGEVSRLEVDALSVRADFLSDELLRSAHRHGKEVHAWTVNEPSQMTRLIKRGVDNLITSDPDVAIQKRDEWASLTGTERLVLTARLLLGLNP
jgi:glycerophosphoryl diester phosphodiesterase